ncbi:MAG: dihydrodipicolinate synthase family protein [Thermodesulfobacteriota bacterium]
MTGSQFDGIFPPISTPFVEGKLSPEAVIKNLDRLCRTGIRGVVVLGSNGEAALLSQIEKKILIETVIRSSPNEMTIIAGTGCESTEETIRLTKECGEMGAHAALVLPPFYYWDKMTDEVLYRHYSTVADHSRIPVLLYNVPKFTHFRISPGLVARLSAHENIAGIKDSSADPVLLADYIYAAGSVSDFKVLVGTATVLFAGLALGCTGGIMALANVTPELCVDLYHFMKQGDFEKARALQMKLIPLGKAVTTTYGVAGLKAAMEMAGYFGGDPRLPLLPVTLKEKDAIRNLMTEAGLL